MLGELREDVSRHTFLGGNFFMLRLLNRFRHELDVVALPQELESSAHATVRQLQEDTATLTIDNAQTSPLQFTVTVRNLTGHKFPTGYPSRRAWLHVVVRDGAQRELDLSVAGGMDLVRYFVSGNYDYAEGTLPKNDSRRVGLRGNTLGASLELSDAALAERVGARIGELQQALERQGLEAEALHVRRGAAAVPEAIETALDASGEDWPAQAREARRRKFGGTPPADFRQRAKQARFLQYRGFSADQVRAALGHADDPD